MQVVTHASEGAAEEALHSAAAGGFASADGHATVAAARAPDDDAAAGADNTIAITGHLPALDGLRGLAVLVVMVCHFTAPMQYAGKAGFVVHEVLNAGWVGVDLFFVLSGFLITGILFDAKGAGGYFRNFYW